MSHESNSPIKVSIATSFFWPEKTGISQVTWELATYLAARGLEVEVVTAMPFYPEWRIAEGYQGRLWSDERVEGVDIRRAWHRVAPSPTTVGRLLHEASLSLFSLPNLIRSFRSADCAFIVSPHLTFAFVAALVARVSRTRFTLVVQDVMPDAAIEMGMLKNRAMIRLSEWFARVCYNTATEIYTLSDGMRRRIARLCDDPSKIEIVPNTIDADELAPPPLGANEFRTQFVPDGVFAVVHTGNMGQKQDLDLLLDTAALLRGNTSVQFYVFGDGADRERFLRRRDELDLPNVRHFPLQERRLLPHMLAGADLVLVSQLNEVTDLVVPSKLLTAMGAGAAIVAACHPDSEVAHLLLEARAGILVPAGDSHALAQVIREAQGSPRALDDLRVNARRHAIARYSRAAVFDEVVATIRRVA